MRVLCCLDGFNIQQIGDAITTLDPATMLTVGFLYVTDTGPHEEIGRRTGPLLRHRGPHSPGREQMRQADQASAQEILEEGRGIHPEAVLLQREGRPEREIVNCAAEWNADMIVICPRSPQSGGPVLGPKSVGHVARFVLDHAPCPVLLVRSIAREGFPLQR